MPHILKKQARFGWVASWHFFRSANFQLVYFGEEESGLCVWNIKALRDSAAGPPLGQKMKTTALAGKSENPAMERRVLLKQPVVPG